MCADVVQPRGGTWWVGRHAAAISARRMQRAVRHKMDRQSLDQVRARRCARIAVICCLRLQLNSLVVAVRFHIQTDPSRWPHPTIRHTQLCAGALSTHSELIHTKPSFRSLHDRKTVNPKKTARGFLAGGLGKRPRCYKLKTRWIEKGREQKETYLARYRHRV